MDCPQCGAALARPEEPCERCSSAAGRVLLEEKTGPMLARANLFRMRGRWADAVDQCTEVLRLDPGNATAFSLLGDIHQDQGRLEEARHWYQLALEANPSSEADRAKLSRAQEMLEARQQRAEWQAVIEGRRQPLATSLLIRESVQRIIGLAGAGLCGIILVMAVAVSLSDRSRTAAEENLAAPIRTAGRRRPPMIGETRRERRLLKFLEENTPPGPAKPLWVQIDPRTRTAHLRIFYPGGPGERLTEGEFRTAVMREGYRLAQGLREADHTLAVIQVYVVGPATLPDGTTETVLYLAGTLAAADLAVRPEVVTREELETFYARIARPVWDPDLAGL